MGLTVVILTRDEAHHVGRAIASVRSIAERVVVVDSGSTDGTAEVARRAGAEVLTRAWRGHADQMNWALGAVEGRWIMRLDADEVVSRALAQKIACALPAAGPEVAGFTVGRRMAFMGRPIRHGGLFPARTLRILRAGRGRCEARLMDEHLIAEGPVRHLAGEILDDDRGGLSRWTAKHNDYASREVADMLTAGYRRDGLEKGAARKRRLRALYACCPAGARALAYFLWRYVARLGFLDGREGLAFHVLQGFWYRFLVDAKLREVRLHMARTGADARQALRDVLGVELPEAAR